MTLADACLQMIAATREQMRGLIAHTDRERAYLLYQGRLLDLLESALIQREQGGGAPSCILLRSALECLVDCANLYESEHYLLVLRAIVLENRYSIYRYKTPPLFEALTEGMNGAQVRDTANELQEQMRRTLKEATVHYPALQNNPRNLSVVMRFRLANRKDEYHTVYTWLSMQAHNDLEPVAMSAALRGSGEELRAAQGVLSQSAVIHFALESLVDSCRYLTGMFGADNAYIHRFIALLESAIEQGKDGGEA